MSFTNVCGKILTRGIGATTLYLIARDAHHMGKIQADCEMKTKDANAVQYYLNNTMATDKPSLTKTKMQNAIFKYELSQNIRGFFNSAAGYFKGLFGNLVSAVIPFGFGLVALCSKCKNVAGTKVLKTSAKLSAVALAGLGVFSFFKDGLGIGKYNK